MYLPLMFVLMFSGVGSIQDEKCRILPDFKPFAKDTIFIFEIRRVKLLCFSLRFIARGTLLCNAHWQSNQFIDSIAQQIQDERDCSYSSGPMW